MTAQQRADRAFVLAEAAFAFFLALMAAAGAWAFGWWADWWLFGVAAGGGFWISGERRRMQRARGRPARPAARPRSRHGGADPRARLPGRAVRVHAADPSARRPRARAGRVVRAEAPIESAGVRVGLAFDIGGRANVATSYLCPGAGDECCFIAREDRPHYVAIGPLYATVRDRLFGWLDVLGGELRAAYARLAGPLRLSCERAPMFRQGGLGTLGDWIDLQTPLRLPDVPGGVIHLRYTIGVDVLVGELRYGERRLIACGLPLCSDPVDGYMATQEPIAGVTTFPAASRAIWLKLEEWRLELALGAQRSAPVLADGLCNMMGIRL